MKPERPKPPATRPVFSRGMSPRSYLPRRPQDGDYIGGRPYLEAHIPIMDMPGSTEQIRESRARYYEIINQLTYQQQGAWCKAFGFKRCTFLDRKYQRREPRLEEVLLTIWWYDTGRTMVYRKHRYTSPEENQG